MARGKTFRVHRVLVGYDSTGPHLEYYQTKQDYAEGYGLPVDELPENQRGALLLAVVRKGGLRPLSVTVS